MKATLSVLLLMVLSLNAAAEEEQNKFNRLFTPEKINPKLEEDGIHDPVNSGISILQQPDSAFAKLDKSTSSNYVDWVSALQTKKISPRFDLNDASVEPIVFDLNIIREVKGSMPNVIYPHKQHTQWLDCSNCHPDIFIPQKGANKITMAEIIMGEKCGVCHGRVAFGVKECLRCHSDKPKEDFELASQESDL